MSHETIWNERYRSTGGYLFGTDPNHFIKERESRFDAGSTALCIADGEGRDSVWRARRTERLHAEAAGFPHGWAISR